MRDPPALLVRRWWAGGGGRAGRLARTLTAPSELLYRLGIALRNGAFDAGWLRAHGTAGPVVSVGNLVVGGTGKTPVSAWLCSELVRAGGRPALVARGYGADELRLHRRWNPDVPVHPHPDRVRAALEAFGRGAGIVVLDDGFQHRRLARDLDLVLLAAEQPFPGRLLPRGPYREPAGALGRADAVLVTRRTAGPRAVEALADELARRFPRLPVGRVRLVPSGWTDLHGRPAEPPSGPLAAVSSVAGPEDFEALVGEVTGTRPRSLAFPDHHDFSPSDVVGIGRSAGEATVVTTEKDAVKLVPFAEHLPRVRVLALRVEPGEGSAEILEAVLALARRARGGPSRIRPDGRKTTHGAARGPRTRGSTDAGPGGKGEGP